MKQWTKGVLKEHFGSLRQGEEVVVIETAIQHTDLSIGKTYFVMSIQNRTVLHLAECAFGSRLHKLIRYGAVVSADKQARCTRRCKEILHQSAYHPKRRKVQTRFFK